jgi:MSHA biogenesis protein MshP
MRRNPTTGPHDPNVGGAGAHARSEAGFSAVTAIVILVILAVFGAAIVTITGTRSASAALDVLGSRAYQAARAGIEWGAFKILDPEKVANNPPAGPYSTPYSCIGSPFSFGLGGQLTGITVTVDCTYADATEFGNLVRIFKLVATSCNIPVGVAPGTCPNTTTAFNYVERQMTAVMETCRLSANGPSC